MINVKHPCFYPQLTKQYPNRAVFASVHRLNCDLYCLFTSMPIHLLFIFKIELFVIFLLICQYSSYILNTNILMYISCKYLPVHRLCFYTF